MKPDIKHLRPGDILRGPDGQLWNVDQVLANDGVLVVQRKAVYDLTGWEPVDSYHLTGQHSQK